ncbi:MAG: C2H2-type zinc finger protein [Eubacterium sp.]|nr:C2H2-type zinc finger protein [Eubacterium sp.]
MSDEQIKELNDDELESLNGGAAGIGNFGKKALFRCQFCGETFSSKKEVDNHTKTFHKLV